MHACGAKSWIRFTFVSDRPVWCVFKLIRGFKKGPSSETAVGSVKDHWFNQVVWGALRVLVIVSWKRQLSDGRCLVTLMQRKAEKC